MIDGLDCERKFERYLQSLNVATAQDLDFWGHFPMLKVHNPVRFHEIANVIRMREMRELRGGLWFMMRNPDETGIYRDWTIELAAEKTSEFLKHYGGQYQIV